MKTIQYFKNIVLFILELKQTNSHLSVVNVSYIVHK